MVVKSKLCPSHTVQSKDFQTKCEFMHDLHCVIHGLHKSMQLCPIYMYIYRDVWAVLVGEDLFCACPEEDLLGCKVGYSALNPL